MKEEKEEIILEQWKRCIESAEKWTDNRNKSNNLLLTLLSLLLTVSITLFSTNFKLGSLIISIIFILISIYWLILIINYKKMSSIKWQVITELEKKLKIKPYTNEWELCKKSKYIKTIFLELFIPIILISANLAIIISSALTIF
ncbi:MAG: RipA family octameric membrane protein [Mycoplasma sp.]